ncbi:hypothetical protein MicroSTF_14445 [Microbacterium sp. STF-2]|nr:hypothetical protein [Microbacterium sp. STF-2]MEA1264240.1 hypothetical protein [Microbacterium sp. STF-2]
MPILFGWGASAGAGRRLAATDARRAQLHTAAVARRRKAKRGGRR